MRWAQDKNGGITDLELDVRYQRALIDVRVEAVTELEGLGGTNESFQELIVDTPSERSQLTEALLYFDTGGLTTAG